jgi:hypothetical protein
MKDEDDVHVKRVDAAIIATCRNIYTEAAPVLYENIEFYITLACSGRDLISMSPAGKSRVYSQLLQDLHGRVRSLSDSVRMISLSVLFTDSRLRGEQEYKWFQRLNSELTRLVGAPKLKTLHITFEAGDFLMLAQGGYTPVEKEVEHVLATLSEVECHATVTALFHPSLNDTDAKPSMYLDTIVKLQW